MLGINEEFESIQGEGFNTGVRQYFIRLQGCAVGCYFCDTKKSWQKSSGGISEVDIVERAKKSSANYVCITGGEPCEQDLSKLIKLLKLTDLKIQIETSGVIWQDWLMEVDWLCVSPKDLFALREMKTQKEFFTYADEFKCVVTKESDIEFYKQLLSEFTGIKTLQPVDNSAELGYKMTQRQDLKGWRIQCQQQKVFQIR